MTFSELVEKTSAIQKIELIIGDSKQIICGEADTLRNFLTSFVVDAEVDEIGADNGVLKVWVDCDE